MSEKQKITTNITPANKHLEVLKQHFSHCFKKNGKFDFEKFKQEISKNKIDFYQESYAMDWLGKSYARLLASDEATTLLQEDEAFNQKPANKNSQNLLIKGDNLEVLKHLSNAYYKKVKMIYIDPPYNTGSDGFVYQDDRKFSVNELQQLAGVEEEKAERILQFTQSNSNSHSAWLTFIYPRLYIAKQLLKEDGVIFVSIDDNEVAQLRLLMDEIFGEENLISSFVWQTKQAARGVPTKTMLMDNHEYILSYAINKENFIFNGVKRNKNDFKNPDKDRRGLWRSESMSATGKQNNIFSIKDPLTKLEYTKNWAFSKSTIQDMIDKDLVIFPKNKDGTPRQKKFLDSYRNHNKSFVSNLGWFSTENSTKYLMKLFDDKKIFDFPKPIELLTFLVTQSTNKDDLVLDFFAGSGTTGDAVMQLNAEDGGNRKYILAQLHEKIDAKKNKAAYDFVKDELGQENPTIFDITKERILRVAKKIHKDNKASKISKDLSKQDFGFKIFETMPIWNNYDFEADELQQQVLFDETQLTNKDLKALLITWKTYDGMALTQNLQPIDLGGYTGHYFDDKLYLIAQNFATKNLKELLQKIDNDKDFNPASIVSFGYHFDSKNLREIAENIKSYANKKSIDIYFVIRY